MKHLQVITIGFDTARSKFRVNKVWVRQIDEYPFADHKVDGWLMVSFEKSVWDLVVIDDNPRRLEGMFETMNALVSGWRAQSKDLFVRMSMKTPLWNIIPPALECFLRRELPRLVFAPYLQGTSLTVNVDKVHIYALARNPGTGRRVFLFEFGGAGLLRSPELTKTFYDHLGQDMLQVVKHQVKGSVYAVEAPFVPSTKLMEHVMSLSSLKVLKFRDHETMTTGIEVDWATLAAAITPPGKSSSNGMQSLVGILPNLTELSIPCSSMLKTDFLLLCRAMQQNKSVEYLQLFCYRISDYKKDDANRGLWHGFSDNSLWHGFSGILKNNKTLKRFRVWYLPEKTMKELYEILLYYNHTTGFGFGIEPRDFDFKLPFQIKHRLFLNWFGLASADSLTNKDAVVAALVSAKKGSFRYFTKKDFIPMLFHLLQNNPDLIATWFL